MEGKEVYLGYANGWKTTPEIVKNCVNLGHKQWHRSSGRCVSEYGCEICKYSFSVDSSD